MVSKNYVIHTSSFMLSKICHYLEFDLKQAEFSLPQGLL